jgi:galactose-1-phosphate uridylyltransferase
VFLEELSGQTGIFTVGEVPRRVTYLTRVDPFSGNVSKISAERAQRNIGIAVELQVHPVDNCVFCAFKEHTPKERVEHNCGAISVPNKYPWEKYDWITIYPPFDNHKLLLSELNQDDLERMMESSYDLAAVCARDSEVISFIDFTNWGAFAGASQQHPHSQRKSATLVPNPCIQNEMNRCYQLMERHGQNPFAILEQEERSDGRRIIHDDGIFVVSMFAPTCPDEILVFPREDIAHILQTTDHERKKISQSIQGIFRALLFCRGVTNLNIAFHMANFVEMDQARKYYRWHMHIYPRRSRLPADRAGSEIGFGTQVIDVLPEVTAELMRRWYKEGPSLELVAKNNDGTTDSGLLAEFHKFALPIVASPSLKDRFYTDL